MLSEIGMWVSKYLPCRSCRISCEPKTQRLPQVPAHHRQRIHRQQFHRMDSLAANRGQLVLTRTHQTRRTSTRYEILFFCFKSINLVPFDLERKRKVKMRSNIPFLLLFLSLYCYVNGWICIDKRVQKKNNRNSGRIRRVGQLKVCGFLFHSVFCFCNWQNIFQEIGAEVTSFWISILGES